MCRQTPALAARTVWLASLFTLIVVGALCGGPLGAAAQTPSPAVTPGPTVVSRIARADFINEVWGSSGQDVFAVGFGGAIWHYDGSAWSAMSSGTTNDLDSVWCSSHSYTVPGPAVDVFAVGTLGTILHYDPAREAAGPGGTMWLPMSSGTTFDLLGLWGSSGRDVFAVGASGTILHYDGRAWSAMSSGATKNLTAVWGSSYSDTVQGRALDVFAVGEGGTIVHYDGSGWSPMTSGTTRDLYSVWGPGNNSGTGSSGRDTVQGPARTVGPDGVLDVFAVGAVGSILHYNGRAWSAMNSGTTSDLMSVWGSSGSDTVQGPALDVFAVGHFGTILHYDPAREAAGPGGRAWSRTNVSAGRLMSVWGSSASDVFAVGHRGPPLHYDGKAWTATNR